MTFRDHFSQIAARYAEFRPRYPRALVDALADRCERTELAWDAGCGNGQLSVPLAERFARVIATDPSPQQLAAAEPHARVEYRRATAEDSGLDAASADLVVAAQAAHWFDWPRYVAEVARVARPGALCALVSYSIMRVEGVLAPIAQYYKDLGPYWPPERKHVETDYRDIAWPWPAVDAPAIDFGVTWTREELCGYIATWSATQKCVAAAGPSRYDALCAELARNWPDGERRPVVWPLAIKLARRV